MSPRPTGQSRRDPHFGGDRGGSPAWSTPEWSWESSVDGDPGVADDAQGWGAPDAPTSNDAEFEVTPDGRLRRRILNDREKWIALGLHLWWVLLVTPISLLAAGLPIGLWVWQKNQNEFLDDQGREAINFGISVLIISALLTVSIVGVVLLIPYWVIALISAVRAAIASTKGEYFRYPMTFRMV